MRERGITVIKDGAEEHIYYFVDKREADENEFGCDMYVVGIRTEREVLIIENFSSDAAEAERLLDYLFENNVPIGQFYSAAEEFLVNRSI